ncbi:hypothetical protein SAMN06265222_109115 [Neorhodopirellula lusitana]|uniref:DUF4034 domain-containing protein n=2 Tax=Neorhodopirellula lusitana TaxID=445327 RepID=A0ABY1QD85_9BACT|nr:hypothetical protein SAMN06265222_109115 [Neorhodopirellula lusitana]
MMRVHPHGSKRAWGFWFALLAPPVMLLAVLAVSLARSYACMQQTEQRISEWSAHNIPTDSVALAKAYDASTSRTHTGSWSDVLLASRAFNDEVVRRTADLNRMEPIPLPGQEWSEQPIVEAQANRWQSLDAIRQRLSKQSGNVWMPIVFDGERVPSNLTGTTWLLTTQDAEMFRLAFYRGDTKQAIQILQRMSDTLERLDGAWHPLEQTNIFQQYQTQLALIRQSLRADAWSDEQLTELTRLISKPMNLSQRWKNGAEATRAMRLTELNRHRFSVRSWRGDEAVSAILSAKHFNRWLNLLDSVAESHPPEPWRSAQSLAKPYEREMSPDAIDCTSIPMASHQGSPFTNSFWLSHLGHYLEEWVDARDWTLTAIAIKQFQRRTGEFPQSQAELTQAAPLIAEKALERGLLYHFRILRPSKELVLWRYGNSTGNGTWYLHETRMPMESGDHTKIDETKVIFIR